MSGARAEGLSWSNSGRVTNLRPNDTKDDPFWYTFKVQCTSCRETNANWVGVNRFVRMHVLGIGNKVHPH